MSQIYWPFTKAKTAQPRQIILALWADFDWWWNCPDW